jgi:hypothetical protein
VSWPSLRGFSPRVAVMEAAQPAMPDDPSSCTWSSLHGSHFRSVLIQREMAAIARIVIEVIPKEAPEMTLVQDHDAIQKLPPAAPNPVLCDAVLPGTPRGDALRLDVHRANRWSTPSSLAASGAFSTSTPQVNLEAAAAPVGVSRVLSAGGSRVTQASVQPTCVIPRRPWRVLGRCGAIHSRGALANQCAGISSSWPFTLS